MIFGYYFVILHLHLPPLRLGCHLRVTEPRGGALHIGKATLYALFLDI